MRGAFLLALFAAAFVLLATSAFEPASPLQVRRHAAVEDAERLALAAHQARFIAELKRWFG